MFDPLFIHQQPQEKRADQISEELDDSAQLTPAKTLLASSQIGPDKGSSDSG